jgi:membrane protease subunit HflK
MAWNDSGDGGKKDPWGSGGKQQPPDLDELLKKLQQKLAGLFGAGKQGATSSGKGGGSRSKGNTLGVATIGIILLVVWALSGFFIVRPAEQAVILQFGKYVKTMDPGLHWIPRFIRSKEIVNVEKIDNFAYTAQMLNKDENIVQVSIAVQYRVADPENFLFNVVNPIESLQQATASSLRQVVGHTTLDEVLTTGREKVRQDVSELLKEVLARYKTGIQITDVAMQPARAPDEVKEAFDDAIKAQEDEQRFVNQAQAYTASVLPIARGRAARILQEAEAYKEQTLLEARGESARFLAILTQYNKAPGVTRDRLYLDALEDVYNNSNKILLDVTQGSNNILYLPLDRMGLASPGSDSATTVDITNNAPVGVRYPEANVNKQQDTRPNRESYTGRGGYQ